MNAQHLSGEGAWYTPQPFIDLAHEVMGGIDFDPASSAAANDFVRAEKFLTAEDDGLVAPWRGRRRFANPPGHCGWVVLTGREARDFKRAHPKAKRIAGSNGYLATRVCRNVKRCSCDLARRFWARGLELHHQLFFGGTRDQQLFWIGFSVNQLRTFQAVPGGGPLSNGVVCIPRERHPYIRPDGTPGEQPSHDSFLFYAGNEADRFRRRAKELGEVIG